MRSIVVLAVAILGGAGVAAGAQDGVAAGLGEVVVSANRMGAPYALADRPVVGLRRQADAAVLTVAMSSDARDAAIRTREIHAMLLAALDRAAAAGVELVTGSFELIPVTRASYQALALFPGGRVDTSQAIVMIKTRLAGSTLAAARLRLEGFIKSVPRTGRGAIDQTGALALTIVNPDQYREAIVKLVADDARRHAAMFGPDYAVEASGVDGQIIWSQISGTDVFLHVPYRYVIVPR